MINHTKIHNSAYHHIHSVIRGLSCLFLCFCLSGFFASPGFASEADGNPAKYPQPKNAPEEMIALIEIPMGSTHKYEIDEESGLLFLDRSMTMPVVYPTNYGTFPSTKAGDNDPLDALVFSREPIQAGVLVRVRPVGVLRSTDGGEQDDKILCVPVSKVDPTYDKVASPHHFPEIEIQRIEEFFKIYKNLPPGRKKVELGGFGDAEEAKKVLSEAMTTLKKETAN